MKALITRLGVPILLAWAFVLPLCLRVISDTDTGWHLAQGRLIAQSGIPRQNSLAWTAFDHPWFPTSWLYDFLAFRLVEHAGLLGLQLLTFSFVALALLLLAVAAHRVDEMGAWTVPFVALLIARRVTERPQVVSWVVLAAVLALCLTAERRGWKYRLACAPVIALGGNFHPGAVFAAIACGLFCLDAMRRERRVARELGIAAAAVLALAANPGAWFNLVDTVRHLWIQQSIRIQEFEVPSWHTAGLFFLLVPVMVAVGAREWRQRPIILGLTVAFAGMGFFALRLVSEFYVISCVPLAAGFGWVAQRWGRRTQWLVLAFMLTMVFVVRHARLRGEWHAAFDERRLPVGAARFVQANHLEGRAFNSFDDGGYLEFAIPGFQSFQDARIHAFPDDFFRREVAAENSPETFQRYMVDAGVEWAIASRRPGPLAGVGLVNGPDWALVYWDDLSEVYVRRDIARYSPLVAADEYRFFTPAANLLRLLSEGTQRDLQAMDLEVIRHEAAIGQADPAGALLRCGAETRLQAASAEKNCSAARALRPDRAYQTMVAHVQRLPAVSAEKL